MTKQISTVNINKWLIISVAVYVVWVFNFLEPFGITINGWNLIYHLMLSSYGLVSSVTVALVLYVLKWKFKSSVFNYLPSTLFFLMLTLVFIVSVSNWVYSQILHHSISGWHNMYVPMRGFVEMMPKFMVTYAVWGGICWAFIFMLQKSKTSAAGEPNQKDGQVLLNSENQSDGFKVNPMQIVCFKTCDNYLEVYYLNENQELQNRMIRSSMKKMEQNLNADKFYRSHQSYIINVDHIKGLKKVKNSHFLEMSYLDFDVSVSRNNVKHIKSSILN